MCPKSCNAVPLKPPPPPPGMILHWAARFEVMKKLSMEEHNLFLSMFGGGETAELIKMGSLRL